MNIVVFANMGSKPGLAEMNRGGVIHDKPLEVCAEEPFHRSHELDGNKCGKESFKFAFNLGILGEVERIVDIETQHDK